MHNIRLTHSFHPPLFISFDDFLTGTFNDLDHHQVAALASCFNPVDKSSEQIQLRTELAKPLQQLQESARKIAEVAMSPCLHFVHIMKLTH